jgi:putative ABC transport system substrate-binding protein
MKAKILVYALPALIFATNHFAEAQQPAKISRIGYLEAPPASANLDRIEAFRQGLRELGYVEGKNIVIEPKFRSRDFHGDNPCEIDEV